MENFKNIIIEIVKIIYGLICLFISAYFCYLIITVITVSISENNWLNFIASVILALTLYILWMPLFMKNKFYINAILFLLFLLIYKVFFNISFVKHALDMNLCVDTGICAEKLEINTEYGKVLINKENCLKYNWEWDSQMKRCSTGEITQVQD